MSGKGGGFLLAATAMIFAPVVAPALFGAGAAATGAMAATTGAVAGATPVLGTTAAATGLAAGTGTAIGAGTIAAGTAAAAAPAAGGLGGFLGSMFSPSNPMFGQIVGGIGAGMMQNDKQEHEMALQDDSQAFSAEEQQTRTDSYDVSMPNQSGQRAVAGQHTGTTVPNPNGNDVMGLDPSAQRGVAPNPSGQDPAAMKPVAAQPSAVMMSTRMPQMRPPRPGLAQTAGGAEPQRRRVQYNPETQRIEMV
jgi:hypothetical protein